MPDMRFAVNVIDWCRYIFAQFLSFFTYLKLKSAGIALGHTVVNRFDIVASKFATQIELAATAACKSSLFLALLQF
jgi:hypothetical protein